MTADPLTPAQREAWELHRLGHSHRTIARRLGITREAVKDRLERARRKLNAQKEAA